MTDPLPIRFSRHAREQMAERGADEREIVDTVRLGERTPAKRGRQGFRRNFQYNRQWGRKTYAIKQILAIVAEEPDAIVVITVYTFYF
ncbi:MAG: DUF4258 domain-containing protein [Chloroflexota bacterium]